MAVLKCVACALLLYALYRLALRAVIWAYARWADSIMGYRGDKAR